MNGCDFSPEIVRWLSMAPARLCGVGVDSEEVRVVDERIARFFVSDEDEPTTHDLLELWTIKEALFKATPHNDDSTLLDLVIMGADVARHRARPGLTYAFKTFTTRALVTSVAVSTPLSGATT